MLVCGVDDAGRGAAIGPLVIAGVTIDVEELSRLESLGVKDSKLISPARRRMLAAMIEKTVENHHVVRLSPAEIDHVVETGGKLNRLNRLEARAMAEVITVLRPEVAYVDASDVLPERYGRHVAEEVPFSVKIVSEHKADKTYPVVSAASIIAKITRDGAVDKLKEEYGNLGSGYVSDARTVSFLESWIKAHGSFPSFVRKSWKPVKKLAARYDSSQNKLL